MIGNVLERGGSELESEDRNIIDFGICILTAILLYSQDTRNEFLQGKLEKLGCKEFLLRGLFYGGNPNVR